MPQMTGQAAHGLTHLPISEYVDNRDEYIDDEIQKVKMVANQAAILKARAPARIAAATRATQAAGLTNTAADDPLKHYHIVQRFLEEKAFYPPHDRRMESTAYAAVHRQMAVVEDQPCLVCGVRHSTLGAPTTNLFGAVQIETHHHTIEWALANAIVPELFNARVLPGLARRAAQRRNPGQGPVDEIYDEFDPIYAGPMSGDQIKAWVDHSPDNLWVLCDVHHRHKFVGIHAITFPIWGPQDLVDSTILDDEIKAATAKTSSGAAAAGAGSDPG